LPDRKRPNILAAGGRLHTVKGQGRRRDTTMWDRYDPRDSEDRDRGGSLGSPSREPRRWERPRSGPRVQRSAGFTASGGDHTTCCRALALLAPEQFNRVNRSRPPS
jgi:hypothetical protein